ncbi:MULTISPECIES: aldo/keto reductase [Lactobacillus]|uniref:aldo/keto reductase n=1 Tax=Lactobacillus TaxID=1578 RepID=UPI000CD91659|nr:MULTISPECIES: aldo/keto reductase [Lactobacillus]RVU76843.1 aldo/keto reductase [Lactobacillus xujianguonis]
MEYFELNNGVKIPVIGYGTYLTSPRMTEKSVSTALEAGYRLIDTAQNYGNEHEVGAAIKKSGINRSEIFVTSKTQTSGYRSTKAGIDASLDAAGLDYFDLMIIHWPNGNDLETYHALEDAYQEGKLRAIGLSNFNHLQVQEIIKNSQIMPAIDQIETHLRWQQWGMHEFLAQNNILHEAWAPLEEGSGSVIGNETLKQIGAKYGKSAAQVMLRFYVQEHILAIPKSLNPQHVKDDIDIFDFNLTEDELKMIKAEDQKSSESGWPTSMMMEEKY